MKRRLYIFAIVLLLLFGVGGGWYVWHNSSTQATKSVASRASIDKQRIGQAFTINLLSSHTFSPGKPQALRFVIRDRNGDIYKAFDTSDANVLMMYVIRKDRTNFQHIHPAYDQDMGTFTVNDFQLPTEGPYRIFAQFIARDAKLDKVGNKIISTPYVDIAAGNPNNYLPETPIAAKLITSADGFDTNVFFAPGDDSPGAPVEHYMADSLNTIAIEINKDGGPFKSLQDYRGSLGRIAAFGPNLEFSSANAEPEATDQQTGMLIFSLPFSSPGLYRLFMQTEANNHVSTFDYNVTAVALPTPANKSGR